MSDVARSDTDILDLEKQVEGLQRTLRRLEKQTAAAESEREAEDSVSPLTAQLAENLAAIRHAHGLPPKQPEEFEAEIHKRAAEIVAGKEPASAE